jgi:hypothetical protein
VSIRARQERAEKENAYSQIEMNLTTEVISTLAFTSGGLIIAPAADWCNAS